MRLAKALLWVVAIALLLIPTYAQKAKRSARKTQPNAAQKAKPPAPSPTEGKKQIRLSTSKMLYEPVLGAPQRTNGFPATIALSPDKHYAALLNQGYSTPESRYLQSIAILDLQTNKLADFPDERLGHRSHQSYFYGLAWSAKGDTLYASFGAMDDPTGSKPGRTGAGIAVYHFANGALTVDRFLKIPPTPLAAGKRRPTAFKNTAVGNVPVYPAGLAVVPSARGERLLIADHYGDAALLLDAATGDVVTRFDLSAHNWIPSEFPKAVAVTRDGKRAWVTLWNASRVVDLDLEQGKVARRVDLRTRKTETEAGSHPAALLLSRDEKLLFCALANDDMVAMIDTSTMKVVRVLNTRLPLQQYGGVYPIALALSDDQRKLFVADASADAIAIFDVPPAAPPKAPPVRPARKGQPAEPPKEFNPWTAATRAIGFIPTEWYPAALATVGDHLLVACSKGQGTGPNNAKWNTREGTVSPQRIYPYILALVAGSIARIDLHEAAPQLPALTQEVMEANLMTGRIGAFAFASGKNPIQHVIYVIRENRTYDQIFGDIAEADGDKELVLYGEDITPNAHKLARQFGVLDNFYVSGEVSGDGHVWSTAAIGSDYTEATVPVNYGNADRTYDWEGQVLNELPLEQGIPDINEPSTGYLWTNAARFGVTLRIYGEYVASKWCSGPEKIERSTDSPEQPGECGNNINQGEALPANVGDPKGGPSPWPWPVPKFGPGAATKPEIRGHFDPRYPGFNTSYPDQLRMDEFLNEFGGFVRARQEGRKAAELPRLVIVRLPNDHTAGTKAKEPKPAASVADNDIALGRMVEAISHSPYWDDSALFVLEDDAQNGADHVDAHRSPALVISKYSPKQAGVFVEHNFYTTVNLIRTMEALLSLPPMNNNDARAALMTALFNGKGEQAPFTTDYRNRDNGLIYESNPENAPGAKESALMDFSEPDRIDADLLNAILWRAAKGDVPMPAPKHTMVPRVAHRRDRD